jgi:hypothetical protein
MGTKFKEELVKRVQPFLPNMRPNNLPRPTLEDIKNGNNIRIIDDETLLRKFDVDHDSINFRLEGAMDQLDMIMDEMSDMAELELFNDYPEIAKVMEVLHEYRRSPKTADSVKKLYNLTRYLNLPARTFELETPKEVNLKLSEDPAHHTFMPKLEQSFEIFVNFEEILNKRLEEDKQLQEKFENEKRIENELSEQKRLEKQQREELREQNKQKNVKNHPYYIQNKLKLTPFD